MLDKELVVITVVGQPTDSFTFYADPNSMSYSIDVGHTNIDTVRANETYVHIRSRNTKVQLDVIFIEKKDGLTINNCIDFFENATHVADTPYKAVTLHYDGREVLRKNYVITQVSFAFEDYMHYVGDVGGLARRANITISLQVFQSNYLEEDVSNNILFIE
jgi:hypothetical protein